jgi:hypothetical protein
MKLPPPTHYKSVAVSHIPPTSELTAQTDEWTTCLIRDGADLPPPMSGPRVFQQTSPSHLMDEALQDMERQDIIRRQKVTQVFLCFLTAKPSGAARFIMDLFPWTPFYQTPPMKLYSAAEVIAAIPATYQLIKIDLKSGFFQLRIKQQHTKFYGIYYKGQQFALQRLPIGHPLAPSILLWPITYGSST